MHAQQRCFSRAASGAQRCGQTVVPNVPAHTVQRCQTLVVCAQQTKSDVKEKLSDLAGLGDTLGPIGLTIGGELKVRRRSQTCSDTRSPHPSLLRNPLLLVPVACLQSSRRQTTAEKQRPTSVGSSAVELGPIGLTIGQSAPSHEDEGLGPSERPPSIHSMTTAEWRAMYEKEDGTVDLWMEDEFNAGSRLVVSRHTRAALANSRVLSAGTGDTPAAALSCAATRATRLGRQPVSAYLYHSSYTRRPRTARGDTKSPGR